MERGLWLMIGLLIALIAGLTLVVLRRRTANRAEEEAWERKTAEWKKEKMDALEKEARLARGYRAPKVIYRDPNHDKRIAEEEEERRREEDRRRRRRNDSDDTASLAMIAGLGAALASHDSSASPSPSLAPYEGGGGSFGGGGASQSWDDSSSSSGGGGGSVAGGGDA